MFRRAKIDGGLERKLQLGQEMEKARLEAEARDKEAESMSSLPGVARHVQNYLPRGTPLRHVSSPLIHYENGSANCETHNSGVVQRHARAEQGRGGGRRKAGRGVRRDYHRTDKGGEASCCYSQITPLFEVFGQIPTSCQ